MGGSKTGYVDCGCLTAACGAAARQSDQQGTCDETELAALRQRLLAHGPVSRHMM
eukprot:CAMPEP_0119420392 /NCGR_PEP_ID=MMETSP1335-20130426/23393_1 /TAXON_ID=259385 /ORGANISM="Chrysoculter rhomboideus, Strain RCC1486" /LENGTH=54 /DNA_ID=CAMNT_0007445741 /DNA_START=173 /DNA_END=337 /DNA_ORIENTATION=+